MQLYIDIKTIFTNWTAMWFYWNLCLLRAQNDLTFRSISNAFYLVGLHLHSSLYVNMAHCNNLDLQYLNHMLNSKKKPINGLCLGLNCLSLDRRNPFTSSESQLQGVDKAHGACVQAWRSENLSEKNDRWTTNSPLEPTKRRKTGRNNGCFCCRFQLELPLRLCIHLDSCFHFPHS